MRSVTKFTWTSAKAKKLSSREEGKVFRFFTFHSKLSSGCCFQQQKMSMNGFEFKTWLTKLFPLSSRGSSSANSPENFVAKRWMELYALSFCSFQSKTFFSIQGKAICEGGKTLLASVRCRPPTSNINSLDLAVRHETHSRHVRVEREISVGLITFWNLPSLSDGRFISHFGSGIERKYLHRT